MGVTKIKNLVSPGARGFSKEKQGSAEKAEKRNQLEHKSSRIHNLKENQGQTLEEKRALAQK